MSTLQERIAEIMESTGMTVGDIASMAGVSSSAVTQWKDGPTKTLKAAPAARLESGTGYAAMWIATGDGPKRSGKPVRVNTKHGFTAHEIQNITDGPSIHGPYPLISEVQAGVWTEICDNFQPGDADEWHTSGKNLGKCGYLLRVKGKSMHAPGERYSFSEGMILHVNPYIEPTPGQFVIVRREASKSATFKRYVLIEGTPYLEAINPDWPKDERYIKLQAGDVWCGVVVDASIGGLP